MKGNTIFLLLLILTSCKPAEEKGLKPQYEDIKGLFEAEALRLTKEKAVVDKTIQQNNFSETKTGIQINWQNELSLFIGSDINKAAWRNSYKIMENKSSISYHAIDTNLRTREILIKKDMSGKPEHILIKNISRNHLYESSEILVYIRDSLFSIDKNQKVLFMGKNSFKINAKIIK
jgi:hypothetical protein